MLHHFVQVAANVTTFHYFLRAAHVQGNLRQESGNIQSQLLALAVLWLEKDVTKLADRTCSQLAVALVHVG